MEQWKMNLYVVWFSQIISMIGFGLCLPFIPYYIQELGITEMSQLNFYTGLFNSLPAVAMAVMAPIWGILADKFGRKNMMLRAVVSAFIILTLMGFATSANQLLILRCAQGLLTGTITASVTLIATTTPDRRLSYALGFLSSSTFLGYSMGPLIGGLIAEHYGYKITFFLGGALMLSNFFVILFLVKENRKTKNPIKEEKERTQEEGEFNKRAFVGLMASLLLILCLLRMCRSIFMPFLPLYVQGIRGTIEGSTQVTGGISGLAGLATAIAGITMGRLGEKYSKFKLIRLAMIGSMIVSAALFFVENLFVFALVYSMLMLCAGGIEPLVMAITSSNTPSEKRGFLFGIQAMVASIGWSISPLIGSYVATSYSYHVIFIFISSFMGLALMVSLTPFARQTSKGGMSGARKTRA